MTQIIETIDVPADTRDVVKSTNCDICGNEITEPRMYDVDEITVERQTGTSYPSDNWNEYERFDVCTGCWKSVVKPIFNFGPRKNRVDF